MSTSHYQSKHFTIEPMADGVFGAIHRDDGWAIANAGIIDLGDGCLVFDTFMTPAAGADLRKAAEALTGHPVRYVVNSHYHNDHIWGNQVFDPQTTVICSQKTHRLIQTKGQQEFDWYFENSEPRRIELQTQLDEAETDGEREKIEFWLDYYEALAATMPGLEVRQPDLTFATELTIQGAGRTVELLAFDDGHTGGDTILHLPDERVLFSADLLFVKHHPYLPDGDPAALLTALKAIGSMNPETLLPGHGPVGGPMDVELLIQYIHDCERLASEIVETGNHQQEVSLKLPAAYADWNYSDFFRANIAFLVEKRQAD